MASQYDNPNPQFTPYIPQYNTQVYSAVGQQKQALYNEGASKVAGVLESIGGLEVYRDADKQYINNKLTDITTKINNLASADWSNQRLVSQVGALASNIYKDQGVQNAVASTQRIKKGLAEMEADKKEGKSNPANVYEFQSKVQNYLDSTAPEDTFNEGYTPYTDITGNFLKLFKEVHPDSSLTQDDIQVGTNGEIHLTKESTSKGVDANKLSSVFSLMSKDPQIQNQIRINANYTYRGATPEALKSHIATAYNTSVEDYKSLLKQLDVSSATSTKYTPEQLAALKQQIQQAGSTVLNSYKELYSLPPEQLKEQLYTNNLKNDLLKSFAYSETSSKLEKSPLFDAQMELANYNLNVEKFNFEKQKYQDELLQKEKDKKVTSDTVPLPVGPEANVTEYESLVNNQIKTLDDNIYNGNINLVNTVARDASQPLPYVKDEKGNWVLNTRAGGYDSPQKAKQAADKMLVQAKEDYLKGTNNSSIGQLASSIAYQEHNREALNYLKSQTEEVFKKDTQQARTNLTGEIINSKPLQVSYLDVDRRYKPISISGNDILNSIENPNSEENIIRPIKGNVTGGVAKTPTRFEVRTPNGWVKMNNFGAESDIAAIYKNINNPANSKKYREELDAATAKKNLSLRDLNSVSYTSSGKLDSEKQASTIRDVLSQIPESTNEKSDAAKLIATTVKTKENNPSNNSYYYYIKDGKGVVGVAVPGSSHIEVPLNPEQYKALTNEEMQTNAFDERFNISLKAGHNMTTDYSNKGFLSAFDTKRSPNSPYKVRYHIFNNDGAASIKLFIKDNQGNSLYEGLLNTPRGSAMTKDQIMYLLDSPNGINNDDYINSILPRNQR